MDRVFYLLLVASVAVSVTTGLSCIGEDGKDVDYFILLKLPDGGQYVYLDNSNEHPTLKKSTKDLSSRAKTDPISLTLARLYSDQKTNVGFVTYNDEDPDGKTHSSRAHAKGVMAIEETQGFWITHSVPSFPNAVADSYEPCCTNGLTFGQHFMCLTLGSDQFDTLGKVGQINWPNHVDSFLPESLRVKYPDFADFVDDREDKDDYNLSASLPIETVGGQRFTVFAKNSHWGKDLYKDLVAPGLDVDLQASTWQNGAGAMDSYCAGNQSNHNNEYGQGHDHGHDYTVLNVATQERAGTTWRESQDHSKWAISYLSTSEMGKNFLLTNRTRTSRQLRGAGTKKYVCLGDINRMTSQEHRGGGTACTDSPVIWMEFNKGIASLKPCKKSNPK